MVSPPEILEPGRRQFGVFHRVLDIPVPQVGLQASGIVPVIGKLVAAGMAQHVWVDFELELSRDASAGDYLGEACRGERGAALAHEHEGRIAARRASRPLAADGYLLHRS